MNFIVMAALLWGGAVFAAGPNAQDGVSLVHSKQGSAPEPAFELVTEIDPLEVQILETCASFLAFTDRWKNLASVYDTALKEFPNNQVARALRIRQLLPFPYSRKAIPVALRYGGTRAKNVRGRSGRQTFTVPDTLDGILDKQIYSDIRVIPDIELNSLRFVSSADVDFSALERIDIGIQGPMGRKSEILLRDFSFKPHYRAEAVVDWGAGLTGLISHSGRVFKQLNVMNSRNRQSFIRKFLGDLWVDVASTSIDKPFHGSGPFSEELLSLNGTLSWRKKYFESLIASGKPLVAACRSGESIPLAQLNYENPGLFQGMIWMAPMHAEEGYLEAINGYVETNRRTLSEYSAGKAEAEPVILSQSFKWFTNMRNELVKRENAWWKGSDPIGTTPILILVGEHDPEVPLATREYYKKLARRYPAQVFYVEVKGAAHDVFAVTEDTYGNVRSFSREANERAAKAWAYVYWFLQTKVLKQSTIAPPDYGFLY